MLLKIDMQVLQQTFWTWYESPLKIFLYLHIETLIYYFKFFFFRVLTATHSYCKGEAKQPHTTQITINSICKHVSFHTSPLCRTCPMIYLHLLYVSIWRMVPSPCTSDGEIFNSHGSEYWQYSILGMTPCSLTDK